MLDELHLKKCDPRVDMRVRLSLERKMSVGEVARVHMYADMNDIVCVSVEAANFTQSTFKHFTNWSFIQKKCRLGHRHTRGRLGRHSWSVCMYTLSHSYVQTIGALVRRPAEVIVKRHKQSEVGVHLGVV